MKKILLDTNFLLAVPQFNLDVFSLMERQFDFPYSVCVLDKTLAELRTIMDEQSGKDKAAAKFVLELIEKKNVPIIETYETKHVDDLILEHAKSEKMIVATQDKELKRRLKSENIGVLTIRQKKTLLLEP